MKLKLISFLIALVVSLGCHSQILKPVKWEYSTRRLNDTHVELIFKAKIDNKWHLYSQFLEPGGPLPTFFNYDKSDKFEKIGETSETPKPKEEFDKTFEVNVKSFIDKATFKQKIRLKTDNPFSVKGNIEYMSCDDQKCIPLEDRFEFKIDNTTQAVTPDTAMSGMVKDSIAKTLDTSIATVENFHKATTDSTTANETKLAPVTTLDDSTTLWGFFFISFLWGLAAIFTPCVFPMIPMTVSFFMSNAEKKSKARFQAIVYGLSIILIYSVIGTVVSLIFGADFANFISTHWIPNVLFFLIFIIFAASFFGMFEITMPSWMVNKADKQADRGGVLGSFFMAFTLVIVSFSCTGPIVGSVIVQSAGGAFLKPIIGMLGFSLAFALPFTLFALFPALMNSMPKSGGWLNSVKVVLGFLELALGLKFLSVADQTYHWGILDREVYLAFWIVIFTLMGFYLLGKLKFSHDSDVKHIGVPRLTFTIITFTFVMYMIPGMWGAPLKALSGYLPPMTSQDFDMNAIVRDNSGGGVSVNATENCGKPKYADFLHLPHGLEGYFDIKQALECSKKTNKPVFVDFTGHGCVNCRKMESNVWISPRVLKRLKENFIIVALYVDDKTELPEKEWITSKDGTVMKTIGKIYADYQIRGFNVNAQPYYVLLDSNGKPLVEPRAYDLDVDAFVDFLDRGVKEFQARK